MSPLEAGDEPMLYLNLRDDGIFDPTLSGALNPDDIMWTSDIANPKPVEVPVRWEGQVKKLPAIYEDVVPEPKGIYYIRSTDLWRFIDEVRHAADKGAEQAD